MIKRVIRVHTCKDTTDCQELRLMATITVESPANAEDPSLGMKDRSVLYEIILKALKKDPSHHMSL